MVDVSFFKEHGYQVIRNFLPKEKMIRIRDFLLGEAKNSLEEVRKSIPFSTEEELIEKVGNLLKDQEKFESLGFHLKQQLSGHYPADVRLSPEVLSITECACLKELYSSIYPGEDAKVHLPPVVRYVLPGNRHAAVPAHQDVSYNKHMDDFFVMWTPFSSINSERGGVEIYEGTQNLPEQLDNLDREFWLKGLDIDAKPIHFEMEIGDVLLLNKFIVHQSKGNFSDEIRISSDFRFFTGNSSKHYLNLETGQRVAPPETVSTG